jgi:hypothetical protein
MTKDEFYTQRDSRSTTYLASAVLQPRPVQLVWGEDAASTEAGQLLILGIANQLARFVRVSGFLGPDAALLGPTLVPTTTLREALLRSAAAIDPFGDWQERVVTPCYTIGIGRVDYPCDLYVSSQAWIAYALTERGSVSTATCPLGASMAACIAVANAFKVSLQLDQPLFNGALSLWNYGRDVAAIAGPALPALLPVGSVLMVGAGAVASSFAFWASPLNFDAEWDIVDRDRVDLTNTNRGLLFTARDAGFYGDRSAAKAEIVASYLGQAKAHEMWYDEFRKTHHERWDLYLPLANERSARSLMQAAYPPVMLHATTSPNWESQLHRHRPARDRCLPCRLPEDAPVPECSRSTIATASTSSTVDAALPFLSATAGAMLAADVVRLAINAMSDAFGNFIRIDWHSESRGDMVRSERCDDGCQSWGNQAIRRRLNWQTRWYALDVS